MKKSWLFKLLGAFLLIIAIGGLVTSLLTSRATLSAFDLYTTRSGQIWAERLAPGLADYYLANQGWGGVGTWLQSSSLLPSAASETENRMMGQGQGNGPGSGMHNAEGEMMGALGQRFILADVQGIVIYDSLSGLNGSQLTTSELSNGTAVLADSKQVGTLIITPGKYSEIETPAEEFQSSVYHAVVNSAILSGMIALILGILLFVQITAPMRKLRKAAAAIANGDLDQRVDIKGKDEFGQLGVTFNLMAESLFKAETQRQHLMADVAHELRTPLTAIQGTLEGIQDGVLPCDAEQLDALYAETTLLNRLIGDLRLLSLAEAKQLKLELKQVDPADLIRQIVERQQTRARLQNIHLEANCQIASPVFNLDPDRITQVFNNLISNAFRYTPQGGTILIEASQKTASSPLLVSVADTGQGIDAENLPYVFDRFYRAEKSRSRASGGSGLGLAIVKELVEAHGGTVTVESPVYFAENNRGYGTRFDIELPCKG